MLNVLKGSEFYKAEVVKKEGVCEYAYRKNNTSIYQLLFEPIYIQDVSIRSILEMLIKMPDLVKIFEHHSIQNILKKYNEENLFEKSYLCLSSNVSLPISHLEINVNVHFNASKNIFHQLEMGDLIVCSSKANSDIPFIFSNKEFTFRKGERITTGLANVKLSEVYDLPIFLSNICKFKNMDMTSSYVDESGPEFNVMSITFGYLLNTVLSEIAAMKEITEMSDNVSFEDVIMPVEANNEDKNDVQSNKELKRASTVKKSDNEIIEMLYYYTADLTVKKPSITQKDIHCLIENLMDEVDIVEFFNVVYKGDVLFPEKYVGLTAYEYRQLHFKPLDDLQDIINCPVNPDKNVAKIFINNDKKIEKLLEMSKSLNISNNMKKYFEFYF